MVAADVTIVVVDDHPLFTRGLELLLASTADGVHVAGTTTQAVMAVDLVRRHRPDVAVLDLAMPDPGGLRPSARSSGPTRRSGCSRCPG